MAVNAARLEEFVAAWRELRPPAPELTDWLPGFVRAWREIAPARAPVSERRTSLTVESLARITAALRPTLAQARASGAAFNVWRMARLGRDERRNADALAQLLAPNGHHGLGALPLQGLFAALNAHPPGCPCPADLASCRVAVEHRPVDSERDRVDLIVDHPELLLFVEVKVDAGEGARQLDRYAEAARHSAAFTGRPVWRLAYLTRRPANSTANDILPLSWRGMATALRARVLTAPAPPEVRVPVLHLLDHFARL